jgi:hypothetical protein
MPQVPQPCPVAAPQEPEVKTQARLTTQPMGGDQVTVSIPLVVVLGAGVWLAWRYMGLRTWQAILCMLLGFLLAATTEAPQIRHIVRGIVRALAGH